MEYIDRKIQNDKRKLHRYMKVVTLSLLLIIALISYGNLDPLKKAITIIGIILFLLIANIVRDLIKNPIGYSKEDNKNIRKKISREC